MEYLTVPLEQNHEYQIHVTPFQERGENPAIDFWPLDADSTIFICNVFSS